MQRLTKQYPSGRITLDAEQFAPVQETLDGKIHADPVLHKVVEKLFEYEQSGLTPEKVNDLYFTLEGVMHNVDKFLDEDELKQHPVIRASDMRVKVLKMLERRK